MRISFSMEIGKKCKLPHKGIERPFRLSPAYLEAEKRFIERSFRDFHEKMRKLSVTNKAT